MKQNTFQNVLIWIGCLGFNACSVGPNFITPVIPPVKQFSNSGLIAGEQKLDTGVILSREWWKTFKSPILNKMMCRGLKHNYDLKRIKANLAEAIDWLNAAKGQLWPQVTLQTTAGRQKYGVALFGPTNIKIPPFTYYEIGPTAIYVVDIFGGVRRTIERQQALAEQKRHQLNAAYLNVTGQIGTTVIQIASLNSQIETIKEIISSDRHNLLLVTKAFTLGTGTRTQILTVRSQLELDETLLPPLMKQSKIAQAALAVLLGIPSYDLELSQFKLQQFYLPKDLPLSYPSAIARQRPDVLSAEEALHAASAQIGIATAHLLPNLTLTAMSLQEALIPGQLFNASANAWSLLANMVTPVFSGGTLQAERRAAINAYKAACANYFQTFLKAFTDISDTLYSLHFDAKEVSLQKKALATAKETLRLVKISYQVGNVGVLDILNAQREYSRASLGYIDSRARLYIDTIRLYVVLGGSVECSRCNLKPDN